MRITNRTVTAACTATLASGLLFAATPATAATTVLDFNNGINNTAQLCGGRGLSPVGGPTSRPCEFNGDQIGNDYGSSSQLQVSYDVATSGSVGRQQFLLFSANRGSTNAFSGMTPANTSFITFTPMAGQEVSFRSFGSLTDQVGANTGRFTLMGGGATIFDVTAPLTGALSTFAVNSAYFATPLVFSFVGAQNTNLRLDDITFDVRAVAPPVGGIPEPASWAMMIGGFGLVGAAQRRQRSISRATAA